MIYIKVSPSEAAQWDIISEPRRASAAASDPAAPVDHHHHHRRRRRRQHHQGREDNGDQHQVDSRAREARFGFGHEFELYVKSQFGWLLFSEEAPASGQPAAGRLLPFAAGPIKWSVSSLGFGWPTDAAELSSLQVAIGRALGPRQVLGPRGEGAPSWALRASVEGAGGLQTVEVFAGPRDVHDGAGPGLRSQIERQSNLVRSFDGRPGGRLSIGAEISAWNYLLSLRQGRRE